jgi:hypothetical protein
MDDVSAYLWVDGEAAFDAHCTSVALGPSIEAVVEAFAVEPDSRTSGTFAQQLDLSAPYPDGFGNDTIQIDPVDGAVVCLEANGWAGVDEGRARVLSAGGVYVSAYRSVNADMQVVCARHGEIIRVFDPLLYDAEGALDEEAGLPFGHPGNPSPAAFALIERLTGVRLTRRLVLEDTHPLYRRDPAT